MDFIGDVLSASISLILRARKLFSPHHFEESEFADCHVYTLTDRTDLGRNTIRRINGARRTMEKGWLEKLIIVVSHDTSNPASALEVYTWSLEYTGTDLIAFFNSVHSPEIISVDPKNMEKTMKQVKSFFTALNETLDGLDPLPPGCFPGIRLVYNNGKPRGYHPYGFNHSNTLYTIHGKSQVLCEKGITSQYHSQFFDIVTTLSGRKRRIPTDDEAIEVARSKEIDEEDNESFQNTFLTENVELRSPPDRDPSYLESSCVATIDSPFFSPRPLRTSSSSS